MMLSHIYSIAICQFWAIKIDKILLLPYKSSSIWHFCYSLLVTNEKRYFLLGECWKRFLLWNLNKFCALKKSGYGEKIGQSECLFHVCWFKRLRFSCWKIIHRQKFIWNISYRWMWIELVPSMDKRRKRRKKNETKFIANHVRIEKRFMRIFLHFAYWHNTKINRKKNSKSGNGWIFIERYSFIVKRKWKRFNRKRQR